MNRRRLHVNVSNKGADGFTTTWVIGLTLIVFVLGLAVFDVWSVYSKQRALTARADAAAAAAAQAIDVNQFETSGTVKLVDGDPDTADTAASYAKARLTSDFAPTSLGASNAVATVTVVRTEPGAPCEAEPAGSKDVVACVSVDNSGAPTVKVTVREKVRFTVLQFAGMSEKVVTASGTAGPR